MKSILLTTTALVAFAGAAAADGHISVTWSGSATAGVAREGGSDATDTNVDALVAVLEAAGVTVEADQEAAYEELALDLGVDVTETDAELLAEEIADARAVVAEAKAEAELDLANAINAADTAAAKEELARVAAVSDTMDVFFGTLATDTGDFAEYAELNAAVTGSVALDSGVTLSATLSVDAGNGYDFADDDGFDGRTAGSVGFDNVTVDAGAFGTLVLSQDNIAHLVDDDDDAAADFKYTNDFGVASVSFAMDIDEDGDAEASKASWELLDSTVTGFDPSGVLVAVDSTDELYYTAAVAADVQWSAKVEAPIADIATVYAAIDEEGGYDVGASATVAGIALNAKVKSEALAVAEKKDAEFDISGSYTISGLTVGAGWNSIDDGDQWRINGSYSMNGITVSASTDEGEDWEVTGSYDLGSGASLVGGVNYTEDAYVGVSFSF